jgi:hypothetical protein
MTLPSICSREEAPHNLGGERLMGAVKNWQLEQLEEDSPSSSSWVEVRRVLKTLIAHYGSQTVVAEVEVLIADCQGEVWPGMRWTDARCIINNLIELYYSDLSLSDLYGQVAHMNDRYDSLGDKVEREDVGLDDLFHRDS